MAQIAEAKGRLQVIAGEGVTWVNVEKPTLQDMKYLGEFYSFHHLDLEDCLSARQLPKIDEYEDYLFILLHFPRYHKEVRLTLPAQVAIFLGRNYLVTVHNGELNSLAELFRECQQDEAARQKYLGKDSGFLLYNILDRLVDYCFPILEKVLSNLQAIEDKVYDPTVDACREVAEQRRDIAALRRIINHLRRVILSLAEKAQHFTQNDLAPYFGDVDDHLNRLWETLEECRETVDIFKDSDFVLSTDRTNRVLTVLTIVLTIMMPFTVVAGIYGMNIPLPGGVERGSPLSFLLLFGVMVVMAGGMLAFFRRRRWI